MDFTKSRSVLLANLDNILDSLNARKQAKKNQAEDLFSFGETGETRTNLILNTNIPLKSKLEILMQEKESLGIYVSGNPLQHYKELLNFAQAKTREKRLQIILIEKIKKIFTKNGGKMMFAVEVTTPTENFEGVIFPKNAPKLSPLISERKVFWSIGKIDQPKAAALEAKDTENMDPIEDTNQYQRLPKFLIDDLIDFENGFLSLVDTSKIDTNDLEMLTNLDYVELYNNPDSIKSLITDSKTKKSSKITKTNQDIPKTQKSETIRIPANFDHFKLQQIKNILDLEKDAEIKVSLELQIKETWKKVKGEFFVNQANFEKIKLLLG